MALTEIYYFSGTGNSLYVTKLLEEKLSDVILCPIASMVDKENIQTSGLVVGFIFPIHLSTIPIFILDFIKKMDLRSVEYVFAVATRIGTQHSAFSQLEKVLNRKKKKLNAAINLNMPSNDPKFGFKVSLPKEIEEQRLVVVDKIAALVKEINNKKDFKEIDISFTARVPLVNALAWLVKLTDNMQQKFYADEKCVGCETCVRVCPAGKIIMKDGKPLWQKEVKCFKCYACLNFCPNQAVQIKGYTEGKKRYSHPYATEDDIAQQKHNK